MHRTPGRAQCGEKASLIPTLSSPQTWGSGTTAHGGDAQRSVQYVIAAPDLEVGLHIARIVLFAGLQTRERSGPGCVELRTDSYRKSLADEDSLGGLCQPPD